MRPDVWWALKALMWTLLTYYGEEATDTSRKSQKFGFLTKYFVGFLVFSARIRNKNIKLFSHSFQILCSSFTILLLVNIGRFLFASSNLFSLKPLISSFSWLVDSVIFYSRRKFVRVFNLLYRRCC